MSSPVLNLRLKSGERPVVFLERPQLPDSESLQELACMPDDPEFLRLDEVAPRGDLGGNGEGIEAAPPQRSVQLAGESLLRSLTAQSAIRSVLQNLLALQNEKTPIYLRVGPSAIERLPWECLHAPNTGFLTLDARWQMARLVGEPGSRAERLYDPPLKMLAVLAAAGVEARAEWDRIYGALTATNYWGRIRVFVAEDDLFEHVQGLGDERVELSYLHSRSALLSDLEAFAPHVVHFFCHGYGGSPSPYLELATRASYVTGEGNVFVEPRELYPLVGQGVWMAVLNCCEGATSSGNTGSLAYSLASVGFPAVIAMRRAITVPDANAFCGAFYSSLFREMVTIERRADDVVKIEWPGLLHEPRLRLAERHGGPVSSEAAAHPEWTYPILYLGADETTLKRVQIVGLRPDHASYERAKLERLIASGEELHPGLPQEIFDRIDEEIAKLKEQLEAASTDSNGG